MNRFVIFLLISGWICATKVHANAERGDAHQTQLPIDNTEIEVDAARGLASSGSYEPSDKYANEEREEAHAAFKKRAKPLKNIFMGIYKNYKSTYLGNKTTSEYKKKLRERLSTTTQVSTADQAWTDNNDGAQETEAPTTQRAIIAEEQPEEYTTTESIPAAEDETESPVLGEPGGDGDDVNANKKRRKRKRKNRNGSNSAKPKPTPMGIVTMDGSTETKATTSAAHLAGEAELSDDYRYNIGPGLNVSLDMNNDIVHVKLDGDNLKEIVAARWLNDDLSEEGRGKKYEMVTKVLPLFILPFLIQSAIVPFLVTKLKLLLVKSILVGKLAIFLLIISAIRNGNKVMQSYEVAPSYWANEPSRRSELAAAASSAAYNGYRVEGKPTTWIN